MKKSHIIAILVIAVAFGVIMTSLSNNSTYASFKEAGAKDGKTFHVVGKLDRQKPLIYDPHINPNLFTFYMIDRDGTERKILLDKPKPNDFEHSDQIVVIGKSEGDDAFEANDILMKCPSKYTDGKPVEKQASAL
ncbi:MAG TPA: cytochrome c maturation protein CcmE [Bacteroidia bacterium]|jgi:cytochrome c-type biogenesis protein CcmE|nr:cytochrome c maturation protein CcmE [Bacteroidia bacterium]